MSWARRNDPLGMPQYVRADGYEVRLAYDGRWNAFTPDGAVVFDRREARKRVRSWAYSEDARGAVDKRFPIKEQA